MKMKTAAIICRIIIVAALFSAYIFTGEPAPDSDITLTQQLVGFFASVIVAVIAAGAAEFFDANADLHRTERSRPRRYRGRRCRRGDIA